VGVCVCVGFVMWGCFGNMCTCIYCVFVSFHLHIFILFMFLLNSVTYVFLFVMFIYSYCYVHSVLYILFSSCRLAFFGSSLTEVFPCFFLSCKANAGV
jgi:hypothetical protein